MTPAARLRNLLSSPGLLQALGCFDALYAVAEAMRARLAGGTLRAWDGPMGFEELKALAGFPEWGARAASYRA